VHCKAVNTFALLLLSILVTLAYIEAPVHGVRNAVHNEGLEFVPSYVIIAMNHPVFLGASRQLGDCEEYLLLVRCKGARIDLEDRP
jgi:hypothetical protein